MDDRKIGGQNLNLHNAPGHNLGYTPLDEDITLADPDAVQMDIAGAGGGNEQNLTGDQARADDQTLVDDQTLMDDQTLVDPMGMGVPAIDTTVADPMGMENAADLTQVDAEASTIPVMASSEPPVSAPSLNIPGFTYVDYLGGGGFADVYQYQDALGRDVAVKVLHRDMNERMYENFQQEAALMAKLSSHPNIITIFQFGASSEDRPYLVMEMYPSGSISTQVRQKLYSAQQAMTVGIRIAGAIETAHRMGVLHRDIKPGNILFNQLGHPALTDFGISVSLDSHKAAGGAMSPQWAAPEQFIKTTYEAGGLEHEPQASDHDDSSRKHIDVGPWSDVYSLAATLWASLVGHSPMWVPGGKNDFVHLRSRAQSMGVPPIDRSDVPDDLERVLRIALSKDPTQRYQTALDFARALQRVQAAHNFPITPVEVLSEDGEVKGADSGLSEIAQKRVRSRMAHEAADAPNSSLAPPPPNSAGTLGMGTGQPMNSAHMAYGNLPMNAYSPMPGMGFAGAAYPQPSAPSRQRSMVPFIVGAGIGLVVLIVGIVAAVLFARNSEDAGNGSSDTLSSTVPSVVSLTGAINGDTATFSWGNPDQAPGDTYEYEIDNSSGDDSKGTVEESTVTVKALDEGRTCITVVLVRADGRQGEAERACAEE